MFFALIKRNSVDTVDIKKIYVLEYGIFLFSPADGAVCLIDIVKKRKEVKFLLDYFGTYNRESFI